MYSIKFYKDKDGKEPLKEYSKDTKERNRNS